MAEEHKGGIRLPDYQRDLALARVEALMIEGYTPNEIASKVITEGYTESTETVKKWRIAVQRRWADEDREQRPARKDMWRRRIEARYQAILTKMAGCKSEFAWAQMQAELTRLSKLGILLDGAHLPVVEQGDGKIDPAAMSPMEREREIQALLVKREAARAAAAGGKEPN